MADTPPKQKTQGSTTAWLINFILINNYNSQSLVNLKSKKQLPLKSISTQQPKQSPVSHNEELTSRSINSPTSNRIYVCV